MEAIDGCLLALTLGATFVARGFSGDKAQLVPIIKAGLSHQGFAFIDVISPCVTFNDHEGSTKSYAYTREKNVEVVQADFVPPAAAITTDYEPGTVRNVMLHDGSWVRLRKVAEDYDPTDRDRSYAYIRERQKEGEVVTGLLYLSPDSSDLHEQNNTVATPLTQLPHDAAVSRQRRAGEAAGAVPLELIAKICQNCQVQKAWAGSNVAARGSTTQYHDWQLRGLPTLGAELCRLMMPSNVPRAL